MENLILLAAPVVGALAGFRCRLFKSYTALLNVAFPAYLSIWSESAISQLFQLPAGAAQYKSFSTMLVCAILIWILLQKLTNALIPQERTFLFPALLDKAGGGICGLFCGIVLINFAAFLLCASPLKTSVSSFVSLPNLEQSCTETLVSFTRFFDSLSFQADSRAQRLEALQARIRQADPPPPPAQEARRGENADATSATSVESSASAEMKHVEARGK